MIQRHFLTRFFITPALNTDARRLAWLRALSCLPSSDLRILTLARNPFNTVGGRLVVKMKPDKVMILFES